MEDIMADDNAETFADDDAGGAPVKKGGAKNGFIGLLKWILIAVAAIIVIVTVVFITIGLTKKDGNGGTQNFSVATEYTSKREAYDWYTSLDPINTKYRRADCSYRPRSGCTWIQEGRQGRFN